MSQTEYLDIVALAIVLVVLIAVPVCWHISDKEKG